MSNAVSTITGKAIPPIHMIRVPPRRARKRSLPNNATPRAATTTSRTITNMAIRTHVREVIEHANGHDGSSNGGGPPLNQSIAARVELRRDIARLMFVDRLRRLGRPRYYICSIVHPRR